MKYLKQLTVTAACLALAGTMSAGAVSLPCSARQAAATAPVSSAQGSLPASLQQLLQQLRTGAGIQNATDTSVKSAVQNAVRASGKSCAAQKAIPAAKKSTSGSVKTPQTTTAAAAKPTTATTTQTTTAPTTNTTATPAASNSTAPTTDSSYAAQVVQLVNAERVKQGLQALTVNTKAQSAAQVRATEIAQNFSHTRPNGTSCFTALAEAGVTYRAAGENIAYGQQTPQAVVTAWMNSPGHRANILSANFTQIGVGYAVVNGKACWSQEFIG